MNQGAGRGRREGGHADGRREQGGTEEGRFGDGEDWEVGDSLPGADEGGKWSGRVAMWERREVSI